MIPLNPAPMATTLIGLYSSTAKSPSLNLPVSSPAFSAGLSGSGGTPVMVYCRIDKDSGFYKYSNGIYVSLRLPRSGDCVARNQAPGQASGLRSGGSKLEINFRKIAPEMLLYAWPIHGRAYGRQNLSLGTS